MMYLIVSEFSKWLEVSRNFSKYTIDNYVRSVVMLDEYITELTFGERGVDYPSTILMEDIEEFAEREKLRGKEVRTINNYLAGIKMFLKFCNHKGLKVLDYNRILFAREYDLKVSALNEDEMKRLLQYMKNDSSKTEIIRMRDFAIGLVFVYTGLRVAELCNLKVSDIRENMQVIGKGGSRRLVYLNCEYIKVIELYLFLRRRLKINSDYVFVSHSQNSRGKPLSRVSIEKIISEAGKKAGVSKVWPHKLRHTCATQMLEHGGELIYISQLLGHKNIKTTQTYLDYSNDKLKKTQQLIPLV